MKIQRPPANRESVSVFTKLAEVGSEKLSDYLNWYRPTTDDGRYLHYDKLRFKIDDELDSEMVWQVVQSARSPQLKSLFPVGDHHQELKYFLTPTILKAISITDKNTTKATLEWITEKLGEQAQMQYLLNDLIEDEAINSSQLEGAATTTVVAKAMLKKKRPPKTMDEKMILGNFFMMKFAYKNRNKDLTPELIRSLHRIGVENIDDENYHPGEFRKTDDVHVVDSQGGTIHIPPSSKGLNKRLKLLSNWVNTCHDDAESSEYFHPLVKAITLHFMIGFEHPFRDGNGRVARALFYWYMFKHDYSAFRYIAISTLLKAAPSKYVKSYLYTETDNLDLTYFLDYQCSIVIRAIQKFKNAYTTALKDKEEFNAWLFNSGIYKKLNDKQRTLFQVARSGKAGVFTVTNVKENFGCAYNTASTALNGLVEMGIFSKEKQGKEYVFRINDTEDIKDAWEAINK